MSDFNIPLTWFLIGVLFGAVPSLWWARSQVRKVLRDNWGTLALPGLLIF